MNNNENINNIDVLRDNLSEMDKIFIPHDLDENIDMEDLVSYKNNIMGFKTVPQNYSLVIKNTFTQENRNIDGFGVKFFMPLFTQTILVPRHRGIKKYNNIKSFSIDGEELNIDLDVIMKIVDPAKYLVEGKNKLNELNALISRLLRIYVATKKFDIVLSGECKKHEFDLNGEFLEFEERYGIQIEKIIIEKVELSEKLKELYNDAIEERQKRIAQTEKLKAEIEKAQSDAEINRINYETEAKKIKAIEDVKNDAYVDRISKLGVQLKKEGFSQESIDSYIRTMILGEYGNTIFMGNDVESQKIAKGIAGSQIVNDLQKDNKEKRRKK